MMNLAERGLYISMLCECWVNRSVPAEPSELAKWLSCPIGEINLAFTDRVKSFFTEVNGELISPEIEKYRNEVLERREKLSRGGKKGARSRWNKPSSRDGYPNGLPNGVSMASREEMRRDEKKRSESLGKLVINDSWVGDYEKASNGK